MICDYTYTKKVWCIISQDQVEREMCAYLDWAQQQNWRHPRAASAPASARSKSQQRRCACTQLEVLPHEILGHAVRELDKSTT